MTHEPSRKKCLITGRMLNATAFGKSGCSSYSKKAINHYQVLRNTLNEQGYELSIADYREYMGYPPLVDGRRNTEAQQEGVKVIQFLKNRSATVRGESVVEPEPEQTRQKKCGNCGTLGHNRRTCPELVEQVEQPVGKYDRRVAHVENWVENNPDRPISQVVVWNIEQMKTATDEDQKRHWNAIRACLRYEDNSPIRRGRYPSI